MVKNLPANAGDSGSIPGPRRSHREGNSNSLQYSCLETPWTEKPGGLLSMGSHRVRQDLVTEQQPSALTNIQSKTTRAVFFFFFKCSSFPTLPAIALVQRFGGQGKEGRHMGKKKRKKNNPANCTKPFLEKAQALG